MTGAAELGQLLVSLQHQPHSATGPPRIKILIRRAEGLPPTKNVVNIKAHLLAWLVMFLEKVDQRTGAAELDQHVAKTDKIE